MIERNRADLLAPIAQQFAGRGFQSTASETDLRSTFALLKGCPWTIKVRMGARGRKQGPKSVLRTILRLGHSLNELPS